MYFRTWVFIVFFGMTFGPSVLQAQEHSENEAGASEGHRPPTFPFVIPVDVIEDAVSAEAIQRSEAESREREKADLAAQQGVNIAAQAMNEATQSMKRAAWWSTWLVGVGTILLVATLWLTRVRTR